MMSRHQSQECTIDQLRDADCLGRKKGPDKIYDGQENAATANTGSAKRSCHRAMMHDGARLLIAVWSKSNCLLYGGLTGFACGGTRWHTLRGGDLIHPSFIVGVALIFKQSPTSR